MLSVFNVVSHVFPTANQGNRRSDTPIETTYNRDFKRQERLLKAVRLLTVRARFHPAVVHLSPLLIVKLYCQNIARFCWPSWEEMCEEIILHPDSG